MNQKNLFVNEKLAKQRRMTIDAISRRGHVAKVRLKLSGPRFQHFRIVVTPESFSRKGALVF